MADDGGEDFDLDYRRSTVAKIHESFRSLGDGLASLRKYVFVGIGAIVVFCAVIFGLTVASFEYTKEFSPSSDSVMTNVHTGEAIATFGASEISSSVDDLLNSDSIWMTTESGSTRFKILGVEVPSDGDDGPSKVYTINGAYAVDKSGRIYPASPDPDYFEDPEEDPEEDSSVQRKLLGGGSSHPWVCWIFPSVCDGTGASFGRRLMSDPITNYSSWKNACKAFKTMGSGINVKNFQEPPGTYGADTAEHFFLLACNRNYHTVMEFTGRHRQLQGAGGGFSGPWWMCFLTSSCDGTGASFGRHLSEHRELQGGGFTWICVVFPYMCDGTGASFGRKLAAPGTEVADRVTPMGEEWCCELCGSVSSQYEELNTCRKPPTIVLGTATDPKEWQHEGSNLSWGIGWYKALNGGYLELDHDCPHDRKDLVDILMTAWFARDLAFMGDFTHDFHRGSDADNINYYNPCMVSCSYPGNALGVGDGVCDRFTGSTRSFTVTKPTP